MAQELNIFWDGKRLMGSAEDLECLSEMMVAEGIEPLPLSEIILIPSDKPFSEIAAELDAAEPKD